MMKTTHPATSIETRQVTIAPIPEAFLARARTLGVDDLGQPVRRLVAEGGEPCRDVLRRARKGEPLILASFSPFTVPGPFKEYGPVYILAEANDERVERASLPPAGRDTDYLRDQFVVRAYSASEDILDAKLVPASEFAEIVEHFFESPDTAFLHVRFPTYGCFACRIDRARA